MKSILQSVHVFAEICGLSYEKHPAIFAVCCYLSYENLAIFAIFAVFHYPNFEKHLAIFATFAEIVI